MSAVTHISNELEDNQDLYLKRPAHQNNALVKTIADEHDRRIKKCAAMLGISEDKVIREYVREHRRNGRAAAWLSTTIGESHEDYMRKLRTLGEYPTNIR